MEYFEKPLVFSCFVYNNGKNNLKVRWLQEQAEEVEESVGSSKYSTLVLHGFNEIYNPQKLKDFSEN